MSIQEVKSKMNQWGAQGIPFLFLIDFEMQKPLVYRLDQLPSSILFNFQGVKNYVNGFSFDTEPSLEYSIPSYTEYQRDFNKVMLELNYGNTFLLNLSHKNPIELEIPLKELFYHAKAKYKLYLENQFVVFSPEIFVKIQDDTIYSFPMKGTIDASIPNAEKLLIDNEKETAEHCTIVDLIRNDLSIVAKNVSVDKFRYIDQLKTSHKTLLQCSSQISGTLSDNWRDHIGDILYKLLPAGSISGAPKPKTVEIIKEVEGQNRGYYTGVMGIYDGKNIDSAVMIRYVEKEEDQYYYRSGGGITAQSDMWSEYQEMIDKIYVPVY